MEVDDALKMMTVIDGLNDGTPQGGEQVTHLNEALLKDPDGFSDVFWGSLNPPSEQTKELFRSGTITTESTIGDMKRLFAKGGDDAK